MNVGTYQLKETKSSDGYNIATEIKTITIKDDNLDGALDDEEGTTGIYKLTFPNAKGFQLPVTGGAGTVAFVAGGIIFVGLGILLLVAVAKKNNSQN